MMNPFSQKLYSRILVLLMLFAVGCGSEPELAAEPEPSPTQEVVTAEAEEALPTPTPEVVFVVVTATAEPVTEIAESEEPTATAEPVATREPTVAPTEAPATPLEVVASCTTLTTLRLRSGPGEIYSVISNMSQGTPVAPQAFVARGFPAGSWMLVNVGSQQGWTSANPQFVSCNVEPATLPPPGSIPPTPTPASLPTSVPPTPTAVPVAALPISVGRPSRANDADPGQVPAGRTDWDLQVDNDFLFRFYIHDLTAGSQDGAGIDWVQFLIQDETGSVVHQRREGTAGYCVFGGGEPTCNPWVIEEGVYKWKSTGLPVVDGSHLLTIFVKPTSEDLGDDFFTLEDGTNVWAWFLEDFPVDVP